MRYKIFIYFLLLTIASFGQEIGNVKSGNHSIKLLKSNNKFLIVYSDVTSHGNKLLENTIQFSIKESVYTIMMDGFKNHNSHQVIVYTDNDTIVKFEYQKINGEQMLKIRQNNLAVNTFGSSTFYNKEQISTLFGNP